MDPGRGRRGGTRRRRVRAFRHRRHARARPAADDPARGGAGRDRRPADAGGIQMMPAGLIAAAIHAASPAPVSVPGAGIFSSPLLLSVMIWLPVLVAAVIAVLPNPRGRYDTLMKQIAF